MIFSGGISIKRFMPTLGNLQNTRVCLGLIVISGIFEGAGLALFLPLLSILMENNSAGGEGFLVSMLSTAGLDLEAIDPIWILAGIVVFILTGLTIAYLQNYLLSRMTHKHINTLRRTYISSLFNSDLDSAINRSHGEAINHLTTEATRTGMALYAEVQSAALIILLGIYMMFSIFLSPEMFIGSMVFATLTLAIIIPLQRQSRSAGRDLADANHAFSFHTVDFLKAIRLVKSQAVEENVDTQLAKHSEALETSYLRSDELRIRAYHLQQGLPVIIVASLIGLSYTVLEIPAPLILTYLLFLARIAPRFNQLHQQRQTYAIYYEAIKTVEEAIGRAKAQSEDNLFVPGAPDVQFRSRITLNNVGYSFAPDEENIFENLNLTIKRNSMIAFVGSSGAGKSTLVDLIAGLRRPTAGSIHIDDTDLWHSNVKSWRRQIGYVGQDITVLNDTVRNNLAFTDPDISQSEIDRVINLAALRPVIEGLPEGLDTMLGESGVRLSGGQRQRLALAMAMVGNPPVLVLDEATSALDTESERSIQQALESISDTTTIFVVAHRLSTVRSADLICVMEQGRIIEQGNYNDLVNADGRFAEFYKLQLD